MKPEVDEALSSDGVVSGWLQCYRELSRIDVVALAATFLALVAFAPPLMFDAWTPRMAIMLAVAPLGLVILMHGAHQRDRASTILAAAVLWSIVAGLVSGAPRSALVGFVGRDLSALSVAAGAGCWSIGRSMTATGRRVLVDVIIWTGSLGVAVGVLQVAADVQTGPLALLSSRPTGFYGNPVYYGAIAVTVLLVSASSWSSVRWRFLVVPTFLGGMGTTMSGSRVALVAAVVALVALLVVRRTQNALVPVAISVGGLLAGFAFDRAAGGGRNAASRLSEDTGSGGGRIDVWRYGFDAFLDRPIAGYGFGRFRPAVQGRFDAAFVRDHAPDDLSQAWFDAHNVLVGLLVAVGLVGVLILAGWVFTALPRHGSPLAWGLVPILLHWGLQPVSVVTLPLAMLMFGAARGRSGSIGWQRVHTIAAVIGAVLASYLVAADVQLRRAADAADGGRASSAAQWFGDDPVVSDVVAQVWAVDRAAGTDQEILNWRRRAAAAEPDRPYWWTQLARAELAFGDLGAAERAVERALELQPTNARALRTVAVLSIERRDRAALDRVLDDLCEVSVDDCDLDPDELLDMSG